MTKKKQKDDEHTEKEVKDDHSVYLTSGKPMVYGKESDKAIKLNGFSSEVINAKNGDMKNALIHDPTVKDKALAYVLGQMGVENPELPVAFGILRQVEEPTYQDRLLEQEKEAIAKKPNPSLEAILNAGDTWVVS